MSRRASTAVTVLALVAIVAAGLATSKPASRAQALPASSASVTDVVLVCPGLDGASGAPVVLEVADAATALGQPGAGATATYTPLAPTGPRGTLHLAPTAGITSSTRLPAMAVHVVGRAAATVAADQRTTVPGGAARGASSAPCLTPAPDWWLTGADGRVGRSDVLVLANSGSTAADISVTGWGLGGVLHPPQLDSYTVPAGRSVALPLSAYVPDAGLVTLHVRVNSGRVVALIRTTQAVGSRAFGTDWLAPTLPPARHLVVAGFAAGATERLLVVTNPGADDATVQLRVLGTDRAFAPAGHQQLVVPAGRSVLVDLSTTLGGGWASVEVTSDHPVTAVGESHLSVPGTEFPDLAWYPAQAPLPGPAVLPENAAPLGQSVRLAFASTAGASVRLLTTSGASQLVSVPAGRTVVVDPVKSFGAAGRKALVVVPVSGEVYVSRTLEATGTHGPLVTAGAPWPLPSLVRLPPVVADLRAGMR